ncbi:aureocin A53 family class IId bacteriocin [Paenarthrobacter nitroguajacolicus]|uniref:aureocin A53 family class IId bacteriocin n=1 Tax=Paenarthrobacter nitroguajacolicus TaxID=211146 RepID=UPI003AD8FA6B
MGAVLRFVGWVLGQVWRWGVGVVNAVAQWARNNWGTVLRWLERGVSFATIAQWIMQILGIG